MDFFIPDYVRTIINRLEAGNFEAFIVGGSVRDMLLGKQPADYDIATNARPEEVEKIFKDFKTIDLGKKYGTIIVAQKNGNVEVTSYRMEAEYLDGRRPSKVIFAKRIEDDLSRRDFTINSMAYSEKQGLIDPFKGALDLKKRIVRTVGNPRERFEEDHLRILRGVRFACKLGFKIEDSTYQASKEMSHLLSYISAERIRDELFRILLSPKPSHGLRLMKDIGILDVILPELKDAVGFDQHNPYHDKDVFEHTLCVVDGVRDKLELRLAALFHDIGKPRTFSIDEEGVGHFYQHEKLSVEITRKILSRLRCSNDLIRNVSLLIGDHMSKDKGMKDKGLKRMLRRVGEDGIFDLLELQRVDRMCTRPDADVGIFDKRERDVRRILDNKEAYDKKQLAINGRDIINLGYEEGKILGEILDYLMDRVLEDPSLNEREKLIGLVKEKFKIND